MKVFLSDLTQTKLLKLTEYLEEKWSLKVRNDFIDKLTKKVEQISHYPESCPQSIKVAGLFKCVVSKQTTFFYRINKEKQEIEVITLFDTRQLPEKLNDEIKF